MLCFIETTLRTATTGKAAAARTGDDYRLQGRLPGERFEVEQLEAEEQQRQHKGHERGACGSPHPARSVGCADVTRSQLIHGCEHSLQEQPATLTVERLVLRVFGAEEAQHAGGRRPHRKCPSREPCHCAEASQTSTVGSTQIWFQNGFRDDRARACRPCLDWARCGTLARRFVK